MRCEHAFRRLGSLLVPRCRQRNPRLASSSTTAAASPQRQRPRRNGIEDNISMSGTDLDIAFADARSELAKRPPQNGRSRHGSAPTHA
jgi:hypothetical protein